MMHGDSLLQLTFFNPQLSHPRHANQYGYLVPDVYVFILKSIVP